MDLIIVESPTKAKTLTKFLQGTYMVEATMGHIRDLPKGDFGVDIEHEFAPSYVIPRDKNPKVKELVQAAAKADSIILATDPDREGEAIAWHVREILHKKQPKLDAEKRIVFHEITETAIREALEHPRTIDMQMVNAQQARRILDRIVGYKLSPLLWQKLSRRWLSAGRVQSVAVRLIVEREKEITSFPNEKYWTISAVFTLNKETVSADLTSKNGQPYTESKTFNLFDGKYTISSSTIRSEEEAQKIIGDSKSPYTLSAVDSKEIKRNPPAPCTTSTLQQEAGRKLYFSAKKTMQVAQTLYEEGIITYHRTDSVHLAEKFIHEARGYISTTYGKEYIATEVRRYQTKSKVAQEAHEAIRPTNVQLAPGELLQNGAYNHDHQRLYELIWKRALASQAHEAVFDSTTVLIQSANGYEFSAQGSVITFDGYLKILGRDVEERIIPKLAVGDIGDVQSIQTVEHTLTPPPRYTEASLVKTLEEKDIGRPSTYAPIISTIIDRHYVDKVEKKLAPTELGIKVTEFLVTYFPDILSLPFTATLEDRLDAIATGQESWAPVIAAFYGPFHQALDNAYVKAEKVKMTEQETNEACPTCGSPLVVRIGRYGKFVACSTFPTCTYKRQYVEKIDMKCPKCGGDIVVKKSRRGKSFYGCSTYPACTFAAWKKEDIK